MEKRDNLGIIGVSEKREKRFNKKCKNIKWKTINKYLNLQIERPYYVLGKIR